MQCKPPAFNSITNGISIYSKTFPFIVYARGTYLQTTDYFTTVNCHNHAFLMLLFLSFALQVVVVLFTDFKTEECCDIVELFDGDNVKAPLITSLSGSYSSDPPLRFNSTQRFMYIKFTTDDDVAYSGFTAIFESIDKGMIK
jgi:hypothetical protein